MYKFEKTGFGLRLTVWGALDSSVAARLEAELVRLIARQYKPFSALVDVREYIPVEREIAAVLQHCEEMAIEAGMLRMAIIFKSPVVKGQVQQIAYLSGSVSISRHIDASKVENAEEIALAWVVDGIEPEMAKEPVDGQNQAIRSRQ